MPKSLSRPTETVLFEHGPDEAAFCENWESELRVALAVLPPAQANLRRRILLQSMGSSPPAWRQAMMRGHWRLAGFPGEAENASSPGPHGRRGRNLHAFLATQREIASNLARMGTAVRFINGQTPPHERQPITDAFRREGGVLVLTQSGTEGRSLQFCHRLVNFDLPWNPMEIEQRIGRLHRIGQLHPVEIFYFEQARSLQAFLLELLQEKLNLFELVVGKRD